MKELLQTEKDKIFYELWKSGFRLINEEEKNSMEHGIYRRSLGKVSGYTINGLIELAKQGLFKLDGNKLTPEEAEMIFNYVKFNRQFITKQTNTKKRK